MIVHPSGGGRMAMQCQKTAVNDYVLPMPKNVGYDQSSLSVLSCCSCNIRGMCLAEKLSDANNNSYRLVKNRKVFTKGQHVFRGGDETKAIYIVSSGSIKSYVVMENGEEQVLGFYLPGDVIGLDAMGAHQYTSSSIALETVTVCKLSLSELYDRTLGKGFLDMVSDNLLREHNLMMMLARKDADGRLASFLIDLSKRAEKHGHPADVIKLTMTRQDVANYLGLAIETVSRVLRRFQNSGMLEVNRRQITIYDYENMWLTAGVQVTN